MTKVKEEEAKKKRNGRSILSKAISFYHRFYQQQQRTTSSTSQRILPYDRLCNTFKVDLSVKCGDMSCEHAVYAQRVCNLDREALNRFTFHSIIFCEKRVPRLENACRFSDCQCRCRCLFIAPLIQSSQIELNSMWHQQIFC